MCVLVLSGVCCVSSRAVYTERTVSTTTRGGERKLLIWQLFVFWMLQRCRVTCRIEGVSIQTRVTDEVVDGIFQHCALCLRFTTLTQPTTQFHQSIRQPRRRVQSWSAHASDKEWEGVALSLPCQCWCQRISRHGWRSANPTFKLLWGPQTVPEWSRGATKLAEGARRLAEMMST